MSKKFDKFGVQVSGKGDEVVVLGHGFGTNQSAWSKLRPWLEEHYAVVTYDMVGSVPTNSYYYDAVSYASLESFAEDLLTVMSIAQVKKCSFVGHSVAGMIGVLASLAHPTPIERLVLIGSSPSYLNRPGYVGGFTPDGIGAMLEPLIENYRLWVDSFSRMIAADGGENPTSIDLARSLLNIQPDIALSILTMIMRSDLRDRLAEVKVPTIIIQTRRDAAVPLEVAQYMHDHIRGSVLEILDTDGHLPHISAPRKLIEVLARSLPTGVQLPSPHLDSA
ncbi:alpha/beta fold hydrolase [Skermanella stibiiresistens]|nr:alpha/beta hydrolase [Skermanella stibiiresistens]